MDDHISKEPLSDEQLEGIRRFIAHVNLADMKSALVNLVQFRVMAIRLLNDVERLRQRVADLEDTLQHDNERNRSERPIW